MSQRLSFGDFALSMFQPRQLAAFGLGIIVASTIVLMFGGKC